MLQIKRAFFLFLAVALLMACDLFNNRFDEDEAMGIVSLDAADLTNYDTLRAHLVHDYPALKAQEKKLKLGGIYPSEWLITNSYYLRMIDSNFYPKAIAKLKGKYDDNIWINHAGKVIFRLKDYVQHKTNDYNVTYSHLLMVPQTNITTWYGSQDSLLKDSAINQKWRYMMVKGKSGW